MKISLGYALQDIASNNVAMFYLWYGMRQEYRRLMVRPNTSLVIEGFPRCANSFAVVAFNSAQKKSVKIAHHLHAEVQVRLGIDLGIPVLVLYREPVGAVTSFVTRHPDLSVGQALRRYLRFYETIRSLRYGFVLADFSEITTNYADVIRRVNLKFGKKFNLYHNIPVDDQKIFGILDKLNVADAGGRENMVARPTEGKARMLDDSRSQVMEHRLIDRARNLYSEISTMDTSNR